MSWFADYSDFFSPSRSPNSRPFIMHSSSRELLPLSVRGNGKGVPEAHIWIARGDATYGDSNRLVLVRMGYLSISSLDRAVNRIIPVWGWESGIFLILGIVDQVVAAYQIYFTLVLTYGSDFGSQYSGSWIPRFLRRRCMRLDYE